MRTKRLNEHNDARCGMSRNEEIRRYVIIGIAKKLKETTWNGTMDV
jgi:hypothetical protein